MLLAIEGGGFFSSSASGYSKGLSFLLLGCKNEDKPMRVSPWNQYQLVGQEPEPDLQLASIKNRISCGCASSVCFGRTSTGLDASFPLKVGPAQQQECIPSPPVSDEGKDQAVDNANESKITLKSSMKMPKHSDIPCHTERRKVQWMDAYGRELAETREFEPSDIDGSDDDFENPRKQNCSCSIM